VAVIGTLVGFVAIMASTAFRSQFIPQELSASAKNLLRKDLDKRMKEAIQIGNALGEILVIIRAPDSDTSNDVLGTTKAENLLVNPGYLRSFINNTSSSAAIYPGTIIERCRSKLVELKDAYGCPPIGVTAGAMRDKSIDDLLRDLQVYCSAGYHLPDDILMELCKGPGYTPYVGLHRFWPFNNAHTVRSVKTAVLELPDSRKSENVRKGHQDVSNQFHANKKARQAADEAAQETNDAEEEDENSGTSKEAPLSLEVAGKAVKMSLFGRDVSQLL
jgi:hypothetical protein